MSSFCIAHFLCSSSNRHLVCNWKKGWNGRLTAPVRALAEHGPAIRRQTATPSSQTLTCTLFYALNNVQGLRAGSIKVSTGVSKQSAPASKQIAMLIHLHDVSLLTFRC